MFTIRQATLDDIPAMHVIRLAVRENQLTSTALTQAHYVPEITVSGAGWVAVAHQASLTQPDNKKEEILGFAIANRETGNIWALFVSPDAEAKGVGKALHQQMMTWLLSHSDKTPWLTTDPGTRAETFYQAMGWTATGLVNGEMKFEYYGDKKD